MLKQIKVVSMKNNNNLCETLLDCEGFLGDKIGCWSIKLDNNKLTLK